VGISQQIRGYGKKGGSRQVALTAFEQAVLDLVPIHRLGLQVDMRAIAQKLSNRPEANNLNQKQQRWRLNAALTKLRERGLITASKKRLQRLRTATRGEIEEKLHLVDKTLRGGGKFRIASRWRDHFTQQEAHSIGVEGLIDGIELFDSTKTSKMSLNNYIRQRISSKLADAVRSRIKQKIREKREMPLPERRELSTPESKEEANLLQEVYALHRKGVIKKHEAAILALSTHHNKPMKGIGNFFDITESRVSQISTEARKKIEAHRKSQKREED